MGLDMFVYKMKRKPTSKCDFEEPEWNSDHEVHYWRKHPDLHGWMKVRYEKHGGTDSVFNGNTLWLEESDLSALEDALADDALPHTTGFFFGSSRLDEMELKGDLKFIRKARQAIADGWYIYYVSSW